MASQRYVEILVGIFVLGAIAALAVLAFQVSGLTQLIPPATYKIRAAFDEIGGLKLRAPVKIGGVQIGEVRAISLDQLNFKSEVTLAIYQQYNAIPDDSTAGIFTAGLLGDNYIAITPMYNKTFLKEGSKIELTQSAMVLEKLIGQFIYKITDNGDDKNGTKH